MHKKDWPGYEVGFELRTTWRRRRRGEFFFRTLRAASLTVGSIILTVGSIIEDFDALFGCRNEEFAESPSSCLLRQLPRIMLR